MGKVFGDVVVGFGVADEVDCGGHFEVGLRLWDGVGVGDVGLRFYGGDVYS